MKILLLSDSHGNLRGVMSAVSKYGRNADLVVHCGDAVRGEADWLVENVPVAQVICVNGNCDFMHRFNDIETIELCGKKIMITHGHLFGVKYGREHLARKCQEDGVDLVFYGHTHIQADETINGVRMINPGSCSTYSPVCAGVELDENGSMLVNFLRVPK